MLLFLWVILVQTEARCSCTQPGSHPVSASQTPKRGHGTAGRKRGVPDPGWNHRQRLEVGAAAGVTPNLQEKPSRDTTTDGFLCILQHICLGRDPWPGLGKRSKMPSPSRETSAHSVCFRGLLQLCPTHARSRGSFFISCSDHSTFVM